MKPEPASGCCAFTCVPDPDVCKEGQTDYRVLRDQLLAEPNALSCTVDTDCKLLATSLYCGDACAALPVSVAAAVDFESQLSQFAATRCSTCMPIQPPCAFSVPPSCINGSCVSGTLK